MERKTNYKRKTMKKVLRYVSGYWHYLAASIFLALAVVVLTLSVPLLTGDAIDCIVGVDAVDFAALTNILRLIAVVIVTNSLAQWAMARCNNRLTYSVTRDIRDDATEKLQHLPLKYLDGHSIGDITSRMISDVDQFADGLLLGFTQLFTGVITILGTLIFMLREDAGIALVVIIVTPLSLFTASFIAKRTYHMFQEQARIRGEQTAYMDEMIQNQKIVQVYGHEEEAQERFDDINERLEACSKKAVFFSSLTNPSTRFVNNIVYAAVAVCGALSAVAGTLTVGQLSCFLNYASQYTKPFNEISGVIAELQNAIACAARVFELMEEEPEIAEDADAVQLSDVAGGVDLEHVSFSYTEEQRLIEDFNLRVQPGQRIAIVGPTGCGKTTLINLLMRFYDVKEGKICVDGTDIRHVTRKSLRENYGMVLQETWLHSGTIRENICMGKPDATEDEMIAAAKASHCHSFIRRLPRGYDTMVGEDGGGLSQGQKQLLCIARVMLCLPPMLILDEATSSIDTRTELKIQNAFATMMKGRTSFIVAHRLSTIRNADVILVMKDGHIIEQGDHETLLAAGGFYATLYNSQFAH
ncbi:MAG: ABC transporter ATP-binding protein [bacterium]|nr:ABC transporter ATP-binding protein [bacterium]MDY4100903.1 ABC transporter ATP-binding protein [Lachnospiraceae bacterium]